MPTLYDDNKYVCMKDLKKSIAHLLVRLNAASKKYVIPWNGERTLTDIVSRVRDGTILDEYPIGTRLIVPYADPVTNSIYDLPFVFGTVQQFEKEDGTAFLGLGLVAEYGVPSVGIQYDEDEPLGPKSSRNNFGNNRWSVSNIRQWLNKSGKNWYTPQHEYDEEPKKGILSSNDAFVSCLNTSFINKCVRIKNKTVCSSSDDVTDEITYDTFFPLSLSQMNLRCLDATRGVTDESEGRYWEYWRNKQKTNYYVTSNFGSDGEFGASADRVVYHITNTRLRTLLHTRSADLINLSDKWYIDQNGSVFNFNGAHGVAYVAPACVIG